MINFRKFIFVILLINFFAFIWWLILIFNTFPKKYYYNESYSEKENTAIVVLTGGKGRIQKGIDLYKENNGKFLIISGVFKESEFEIKDLIDKQVVNQSCCIFYDKEATNTIENAYQVKKWLINNREINRLILVSSYYHLPRSFIIFSNIIKNKNISLVPAIYNLRIDKSIFFHIKLITLEYFKIIYTMLSFK